MATLFGLLVFMSMIVVGIFLGASRAPLTPTLVLKVYAGMTLFYLSLGSFMAAVGTDFLYPEGLIELE